MVDIAVKYDSDAECFGWCYDNYWSTPQYKNEKWKIAKGEYIVRIELRYGGKRTTGEFMLDNRGDRKNFQFRDLTAEENDKYKEMLITKMHNRFGGLLVKPIMGN